VVAIVSVFTHDQLMDQHYELHAVRTQNSLENIIRIVVVSLQILSN